MASVVAENQRLLSSLELPECEGPKLKAFPHRDSTITWLEWINPTGGGNGPVPGGECCVFKVEIESRIYALKVFKFFKPYLYKDSLGPIIAERMPDVELGFHTDPFYAECRAYAQIEARRQKQGLKRKDIADCYGFLALTKADEKVLEECGIDLWCDIDPDDEYRIRAEGSPARALVKEYIEDEDDDGGGTGTGKKLDEKMIRRMIKTVKWMNRNGILIADVAARNFKRGYLLDLGSAWTKPHCIWRNMPKERMACVRMRDLVIFEEMMDDMRLGPNCSLRSRPIWSDDEDEDEGGV